LAEREALLKDPHCIEVRAEDLATDWPAEAQGDHTSLQRHGRSVTADLAAEINRRPGRTIEQLGYNAK
jgi:hypothetical protein